MPSRETDILFIGPQPPEAELWREGDDLRIRSRQHQPDLDAAISFLKKNRGMLVVDGASLVGGATEWEHHLESQLEQSLRLEDRLLERSFMVSLALREARSHLTLVKACSGALDASPESGVSPTTAVKQISRALRRLERILSELTFFTEDEMSPPQLNLTEVDLSREISEVVRACKVQANAKGISLSVHYWEPLPERLVLDAERVKRVFGELMGSAIELAPQGEVHAEVAYVAAMLELTVTTTAPAFPFGCEEESAESSQDPRAHAYRARLAFGRRLALWMGGDLIAIGSRGERGNGVVLTVRAELAGKAGGLTR